MTLDDDMRKRFRAISIPPETLEAIRRATKAWNESWEAALPTNWVGLGVADATLIVEIVSETGYSLVWLPRHEIVREVMEEDRAEVPALLFRRRNEVL